MEMRGGEKHRYHTILEAGQYVEFTAEQRGIDVRLYLYDPAQTLLTRGESPNGKEGPETIPWIAKIAGTYTLEVEANESNAPSGQYELRIAQLRPVAAQDELLVRAASDLSEGVILEFDQEGPDPLSVAKYKAALPVLRQLQDLNRVGVCRRRSLRRTAADLRVPTLRGPWRNRFIQSPFLIAKKPSNSLKKMGSGKSQAPWTYRAGIAYDETGQKDKAAVFYQKAASLYSGVEDKKMEARVLASLAYLQIKSGRYQDALSPLEHECKLRESSDSSVELATCLNHLGFVYLQVGQKDKVLVTHQAAIEAAQRARDKGQEALALEYRGDFYVAAREPLKAMEEFRKEIPLRQATNDKAGETAAYLGLASACEFFFYGPENDKYRSQRREYLSQALEVARSGKLLHEQAHILRLIGNSYEVGWFTVTEAERKQLREDRDVLRESRTLYHTNGTPAEEAQVSIDLAKIDGKLDETQEARADLQRAITLYHEARDGDGEAEALDGIAKEYFRQKDLANALAAYRQLEQVRTAQNKPKETAFAIASQGKMQLAMGNTPEAIRLFELALADIPGKGE